jgi:hypothetical protein
MEMPILPLAFTCLSRPPLSPVYLPPPPATSGRSLSPVLPRGQAGATFPLLLSNAQANRSMACHSILLRPFGALLYSQVVDLGRT